MKRRPSTAEVIWALDFSSFSGSPAEVVTPYPPRIKKSTARRVPMPYPIPKTNSASFLGSVGTQPSGGRSIQLFSELGWKQTPRMLTPPVHSYPGVLPEGEQHRLTPAVSVVHLSTVPQAVIQAPAEDSGVVPVGQVPSVGHVKLLSRHVAREVIFSHSFGEGAAQVPSRYLQYFPVSELPVQ